MTGAAPHDIFISHKSEFKPWVEWLARALQDHERSVFLDGWHLVPGDLWLEGLHSAVQTCKSAILVATPEAVNSGWVREEFAALQRRRHAQPGFRIVPLVFGNLPNLPFLSNLQCVDCREPGEYRRWFHKLLCGLDGLEPGHQTPAYPNLTAPPEPTHAPGASVAAPAEQRFVSRVLQQLGRANCPPVMVLSQGQRHQGAVIAQLREQARARFGPQSVLHVVPPFSDSAPVADCFAELGRQCRLPNPTPDANRFIAAIDQRVASADGTLLLMISGFENAAAAYRADLAKTLRSLGETQADRLRVLLVGGHRLAEQRNGRGDSSFLSMARVEEWPHPTVPDVVAWLAEEHPEAPALSDADAQALLAATGGHAALVQHALRQWAEQGPPGNWQAWCETCPEVWESWSRLRRDVDEAALRAALDREQFGPNILWPLDPVTRALYWADLLRPVLPPASQLVWRCAVLRHIGRQVLA